MAFAGFPPAALTFLAELGRNNNRVWFHDHRSEYESRLLEPARDFVEAMETSCESSGRTSLDPV